MKTALSGDPKHLLVTAATEGEQTKKPQNAKSLLPHAPTTKSCTGTNVQRAEKLAFLHDMEEQHDSWQRKTNRDYHERSCHPADGPYAKKQRATKHGFITSGVYQTAKYGANATHR